MKKIDIKYLLKYWIKYLWFRIQRGGRMKDYFRVRSEKYPIYLELIQKWKETNPSEREAIGKEIIKTRNYISKYGMMVVWKSWKNYKNIELETVKEDILNNYDFDKEYFDEITFLREQKRLELFPYNFINSYIDKEVFVYKFSEELKYVLHNNRKLFFPAEEDNKIRDKYIQLIMEQDHQSPHRYFDKRTIPDNGCIFVDVGAAEGIMSLEYAEKASEIYLLECSKKWINALEHTFEKWKDKTQIVEKYVGLRTYKNNISIDDLLEDVKGKHIVIKMDIEGMELEALLGAEKTLKNNKCIIACTTYHTETMFDEIKKYFDLLGYYCEPSNGVMLFIHGHMTMQNGMYEKMRAPYFRKGVIRATNEF